MHTLGAEYGEEHVSMLARGTKKAGEGARLRAHSRLRRVGDLEDGPLVGPGGATRGYRASVLLCCLVVVAADGVVGHKDKRVLVLLVLADISIVVALDNKVARWCSRCTRHTPGQCVCMPSQW